MITSGHAPQGYGAPVPIASNSASNIRHTWAATFKHVMTQGLTPLWIAGICTMTTVALIAALVNQPAAMDSSSAGSAGTGGAALIHEGVGTTQLTRDTTNNQGGSGMQSQSQSSHTSASVHSDNSGTTVTVNGQTQTVPAGQSVDRTITTDENGTHTEVHISAQSNGDNSGAGFSNQLNVNVQAQSTSEGGSQQ